MKQLKAAALFIFLFGIISSAYGEGNETLTITTYYPLPYGSYNELHISNKLGIGTTNPGAANLTVNDGAISHDADNVFIGNNTTVATHIDLGVNSSTGNSSHESTYCTISGGSNNNASDAWAVISGGMLNKATDNFSCVGGGYGNNATGNASVIAGGRNNTAAGSYSVAGGGDNNTALYNNSTVSGGNNNFASGLNVTTNATVGHTTIIGGYNNKATTVGSAVLGGVNNTAVGGEYSVVTGGYMNNASGLDCGIGGGRNNNITDNNISGEQPFSSRIAGGVLNSIRGGCGSTVLGGYNNYIGAMNYSVIGGGNSNFVGYPNYYYDNATVMGGYNNTAIYGGATVIGGDSNVANSGAWDFCNAVGGGSHNYVASNASFIGGGYLNYISPNNFATIGGGYNNNITGACSTISGGAENMISGSDSAIPGGLGNNVTGHNSLAAGRYANAINSSCFVWGGIWSGTSAPCYDNGAGTFNIYASSVHWNGGLATGCDIAEFMDIREADAVRQMDLVSIAGENLLGKSLKPYDPNLVGVISSNKTTTLHLGTAQDPLPGTQRLPVALVGRCFVKVCAESGSIELGDAITSSSIPGIGMKAAKSGKIIGYAMQKAEFKDPKEIREIFVFIKLGSRLCPEDAAKLAGLQK